MRNQVFFIWNDYLNQGCFEKRDTEEVSRLVYKEICKEAGKKRLVSDMLMQYTLYGEIEIYFGKLNDVDEILDIIQIFFHYLHLLEKAFVKHRNLHGFLRYSIMEAVNDLNIRFKENGIGYELVNGMIIKIDNELLHQETINCSINLLHNPDFANANEEFSTDHQHYRKERNKECLNECLKSFETTMKIICYQNEWKFNEKDTPKPLINLLITNQFMPSYNESYLSSLRQLLESSIPTIRNKNSGHGQGIKKVFVPNYLASYLLYITGATIRLLIETQASFAKNKSSL